MPATSNNCEVSPLKTPNFFLFDYTIIMENNIALVVTFVAVCVMVVVVMWYVHTITENDTQCRLRHMAINTVGVFNDVKMYYWVDFGTLLGIIREDDIIIGDNDVDICIRDDKVSHTLMRGPVTQRLRALGYEVTKEPWSAYRIRDGDLFVDVYLTGKQGGTIIGATGENSNISDQLVGMPQWYLWKKPHVFVKTPQNVHETLVWRYGEDYMTPRPGYKGRDPP
jgi:hypothetical protein